MRLRTLSKIKRMDLGIYFKGTETGAATVNLLQPLRKQPLGKNNSSAFLITWVLVNKIKYLSYKYSLKFTYKVNLIIRYQKLLST